MSTPLKLNSQAVALVFAFVLAALIALTPAQPVQAQTNGAFIEQGGIVIIEAESADSLPLDWKLGPNNTTSPNINNPGDATNAEFITWEGSQNLDTPGTGIITYRVKINNTGTYAFSWRNQVGLGTNGSEHNDTWLKIESDNFFGRKGSSTICPKGLDPQENSCVGGEPNGAGGAGWFKVYTNGNEGLDWNYKSIVSDNDGHAVRVVFSTPGVYNVSISARSSHHILDRLVLVRSSLFGSNGQDPTIPESDRVTNDNDTTPPVLTLNGDDDITVEVGQPFNDPGATATDNADTNINNKVKVFGTVDTNTPGVYELLYTVADEGGNSDNDERTVTVVDPGKPAQPEITSITTDTAADDDFITSDTTLLIGGTAESNTSVEVFADNNSLGTTTAAGNGTFTLDATASPFVPGTYELTATATNTGNSTTSDPSDEVTLVVDTAAPTITLNGANLIEIARGGTYNEPGATATDVTQGDLDNELVIDGSAVNTNVAGDYTVTYNVQDVAGNPATQVTRTVRVLPPPPVAVCQDVTLKIPLGGNSVTVTPDDVDGGSTSTDGIASRSVNPSTITPASPGQVVDVTLTITSTNTTTDSCNANVTLRAAIDVNGDNIVSPADAVFVVNRIGMQNPTAQDLAADVNGDNQITEADLQPVLSNLGATAN